MDRLRGRLDLRLEAFAPSSSETMIDLWLHRKLHIILPCPREDEEDDHYVYVIESEFPRFHCCSTPDELSAQFPPSNYRSLTPKILAFARDCGATRVMATANVVISLWHEFANDFANRIKSLGTRIPLKDSQRVTCAICLEEVPGELMEKIKLPCSHAFHRGCIFPWLSEKNSCPMCRYKLQRYKVLLRSACTTG